jgi:diguanylate cyclase
MFSLTRIWRRIRLRWHGGMPLRDTVALGILIGVTTPALLLLTVEQKLAQQAQLAQTTQAELSLMSIGSLSLAEPMWVVDSAALNTAATQLLENPQVVAVRIEQMHSSAPAILRIRDGHSVELAAQTQADLLRERKQTVARGGETLGTVTLWFDAEFGQGHLRERRSQMLWLVAVQVLASLAFLMPLLVSRVVRPVERLKLQTTALLDHGDDASPVEFDWKRQDELGQLGRHLGQVKGQLAQLFGQLESKNNQLEQMAMYDQLTGLPNRTLFLDLVQREMQHARRANQRFGIFFIDLDRFKAVNDSLGHAAGDALLVEISRRLRNTVRESDVVCRQSGDEFLVLARDITQWEVLGEMAQRALIQLEQPVLLGSPNQTARISASIGICLFPDDAEDFEQLLQHADTAMYQAKSKGRASYSFFHPDLNARLQANLELEQGLDQAIRCNELVLHYQPQVDASTGRLVGVEALVRWQHPERGLLYPGAFIGLAEESGKIAAMGVWTLTEACRQLAAWKSQGLEIGIMSVNVSAHEFRDQHLLQSLQNALQQSALAPAELEVEITESALMEETDTSQQIIHSLRELGVGISIDDFGTGYSSLSYLKRLRPNQLKIDRSFVHDIPADKDSCAIVKGIMGLAQALSLTVVAEGIETPEQEDYLRSIGCQTLQGFYIGRPMPRDQLETWLAKRYPQLHTNAPVSQIV